MKYLADISKEYSNCMTFVKVLKCPCYNGIPVSTAVKSHGTGRGCGRPVNGIVPRNVTKRFPYGWDRDNPHTGTDWKDDTGVPQ